MTFELLLLLIGAAGVSVLFRACDPFGINAMQRAMRAGNIHCGFLTHGRVKRPVPVVHPATALSGRGGSLPVACRKYPVKDRPKVYQSQKARLKSMHLH